MRDGVGERENSRKERKKDKRKDGAWHFPVMINQV
jgi:hypothetical protein